MTFDYAPGVQINYEIRGHGESPALLLHGFGASLETWRDIQPYLEPCLRLFLLDLKGFGFSSKPNDGAYSMEDQASIVASFIRRNDLSGVCLVGHSYGGAVALLTYLALAGDDGANRVRALILLDSPAAKQKLPFFISPLTNPLLRPLLYLVPKRTRARYVLRRLFFDPAKVTRDRVERYARMLNLPGSFRALVAIARQIIPKDPDSIAARLADIRVPALLIWGDHDEIVPLSQAELMQERMPNSRLVIIDRCRHMPAEEYPEETARVILSFLAGLSAGSPPPPCG